MIDHRHYIQRCLYIAKNGMGATYPNPSVGAVVVYKDTIIGEGFTSPYGKNHAEVNAIKRVKNKALLKKSTIYVTLEPCVHHGKTPPCTDLITKHQLKNVVIGCIDSNSLVAGKGIQKLKDAGCNVIVGILEEECKKHHQRFFTFHNKNRPFIILKWAATEDNFIAPLYPIDLKNKNEKLNDFYIKRPVWISNQYSRQLVHKWRSEEHAILVGTNTVMADNPKLDNRNWNGLPPIKIVLDRNLRIPQKAAVFEGNTKIIVLTEKEEITSKEKNLFYEKIHFSSLKTTKNMAKQICEVLQKHAIQSVIIEGGTQTIQTFINENLWDEARIFIGSGIRFRKGTKAPNISGKIKEKKNIQNDILKIITND